MQYSCHVLIHLHWNMPSPYCTLYVESNEGVMMMMMMMREKEREKERKKEERKNRNGKDFGRYEYC